MFGHPKEGYTPKGYRFYVDFNMGWGDINLYMFRRTGPNSSVKEVGEVVWAPLKEGMTPCDSTVHLDTESMQHMFNALWDFGFRPQHSVNPDALVTAKNEHISDLREIINQFLKASEAL